MSQIGDGEPYQGLVGLRRPIARPVTWKTFTTPGGLKVEIEDDPLYDNNNKSLISYNPGSILEVEYKSGDAIFKELFIRSTYRDSSSQYLTNLKTGEIMNLYDSTLARANIINIIVKKEV